MSLSEAKQVPLRIEAAFWSLTLCGHHSPLNLAPETEHKLFCILGRRLWVWLLQADLCALLWAPWPSYSLA